MKALLPNHLITLRPISAIRIILGVMGLVAWVFFATQASNQALDTQAVQGRPFIQAQSSPPALQAGTMSGGGDDQTYSALSLEQPTSDSSKGGGAQVGVTENESVEPPKIREGDKKISNDVPADDIHKNKISSVGMTDHQKYKKYSTNEIR